MTHRLPVDDRLDGAKRVLLLGAGGGYDVMGAVPLFSELRSRGVEVHLANVSFAPLESLAGAEPDPEQPVLYRVPGSAAVPDSYCPEAWLARWLEETHRDYKSPVWAFSKTGVKPMRAALSSLLERLKIDLLVLVDGGIDLILRGDETSIGTPAEDLTTLAAASVLEVPSIAMCVGFGSELREGIPHAQVLERIAELQRFGAFLGCISLDPWTQSGAAYLAALEFVRSGQQDQRGTHIHRVIQAAMTGKFGLETPDVWISPLAALRWYFDVRGLAVTHLFLPQLAETQTIWDVTNIVRACRKDTTIRPPTSIPL